MSEKGSVFQKGGGGTNFEQSVQAAFLTTLIIKGNAPCLPSNEIVEVGFQNTNRGYQTDDLLVVAKSMFGSHRLLFQIKHDVSFTAGNTIFREVIQSFWKDYSNEELFDKSKDKLVIVKNGLTKHERNHVKSIFNWANTHATENDFLTEVNRIKGKKECLDTFHLCLKEANDGVMLSDNELWKFLKCLDVLEYDFLNQGSVDEIYFLNLIKLSKSTQSSRSEKDIWNDVVVLASRLNKDGGNSTTDSIQMEAVFLDFSFSKIFPFYKAVEKLKSDSEEILKPLKNTIGEFHLTRTELRQKILNSINSFQFTIVTGKPGVGKSAEIKGLLKEDFSNAGIFVFRADQFNQPHIANVLSSQGVNERVGDIFSCISLISDKIIFVDSLEKLLEADPECAFKQLMELLTSLPDIKVVASSRKYAIDLIVQKFGIDKDKLGIAEVLPFDDDELAVVATKFPQIETVLRNPKIKVLLKSPKYLDFAISALSKTSQDFSGISLSEFKNDLWNILVADVANTRDGMPIKREKAFVDIAVRRAKEMKLFTQPGDSDASAIQLLERDEILFQEKLNRKYAPTHDILEDWALVHHVAEVYEDSSSPNELFRKLGTEPAIRRAFRLWVEDYLVDNSDKVNDFIYRAISDFSVEKYWADELLIAVFKSENCQTFFDKFENHLLESNANLLNRCLHLIKTCCKESNFSNNNSNLLLPIGSGWTESLIFVSKNIQKIENLRLPVVNFLYEWEYLLIFRYSAIPEADLKAAKSITLTYIGEIQSGDKFWTDEALREKAKTLISVLYNLAEISKQEIKNLIESSQQKKEKHSSWRSHDFYEAVLGKALSGIANQRLIKACPEIIVNTAWKAWKSKPIEKPRSGSVAEMIGYSSITYERCWGIEDKSHFFPSGVYKVPIYNLLQYHPAIGLKFVTEFLNYSVEFYTKVDCEHKHSLKQIEVKLNDDSVVVHWSGSELWCAFRGTSVTHYAIECLLMSLEKYLLETASVSTQVSRKNLKYIFDYLLRNSNNTAVSSVLASVAMAYPKEVDEAMLPILRNRENYEWDLNRALKESSTLSPMDDHISFAQEERWKSNQLPHRTKYRRGLVDFIVDYQFNVRTVNKEIFEIFDRLKADAPPDDIIWKKILTEMDARNHKIGDYDETIGGFPIVPEYDEAVSQFIEENKEGFEDDTRSMTHSSLLTKAYEKKERIEFNFWESCFKHYSDKEKLNIFYDRPVTLAFLGLRDFLNQLNDELKAWCVETIVSTLGAILQECFARDYGLNTKYNLLEKDISLSSFHLLLNSITDKKDKTQVVVMAIYVLFAPLPEHEVDKILKYLRTEFFKNNPDELKRIWFGLIKYAQFRKLNPYFYDDQDLKKLRKVRQKEARFIQKIAASKNLELDISNIDFQTFKGYILARAFAITPYNITDNNYSQFIERFLILFFEDLSKKENYSYKRVGDERQISHHAVSDCRHYLIELSLRGSPNLAKRVFDLIIDAVSDENRSRPLGRDDLEDFLRNLLEFTVYELDTLLSNSNDETEKSTLIDNFWKLWIHLASKMETNKLFLPANILLLDIKWKETASHWLPLEGRKEFYYSMIREFGSKSVKSILNVFSTIGEKTFLPNGLSLLVNILKNDEGQILSLTSTSAERFVKRLFYNHITEIKSNKQLISDLIWLLNKMVDLGSSEAYLFRENVITYKHAR